MSNLEIINQSNPKLIKSLNLSMRFGKTIIIQEIGSIDPVMFPILKKDFV